MNEKDAVSLLKEQGWSCGRDDAGDYFCTMEVGQLQLQIIPSIAKRADHYRVSLMPSISSRAFSEAVSFILGRQRDHVPIVLNSEPAQKLASISTADISRIAGDAVSWASSQSLESGLTAYRMLPTDAKGELPLRHLAALAMAHDIDRLESYRQSFEAGNRLGFVPYITLEMIDRALILARSEKSL